MLKLQTLKRIIIYCILAPYDNEQWDLMNRVAGQRELESVPDYKVRNRVECFVLVLLPT